MSDRFQEIRALEAMLFASAEPLGTAELAKRMPEIENLEALLDELAALYANRGVNLVRIGQQWAFRTAPDLAGRMSMEKEVPRKLSRAAVETLAIVAYHQPVTRAEIEEIRGVALSRGTLDTLLEAGWIRPKGRRRTPGKPVTWATTDGFLDHFGLESLDSLPGQEELKAAGLLDARPAIAALGERGLLLDQDEPKDEVEEDELDEQEAAEVLKAEFGAVPAAEEKTVEAPAATDPPEPEAGDSEAGDSEAGDSGAGDSGAGEPRGDGESGIADSVAEAAADGGDEADAGAGEDPEPGGEPGGDESAETVAPDGRAMGRSG